VTIPVLSGAESATHGGPRSRQAGLDVLRLGAAAVIFVQHSISSSHLDEWIDIAGFRIGRIGTAIFFMLAGLLAGGTSRPPVAWFRNRLRTLFPPFWLATAAGFLLAGISHFKSFDAWQVLCQMAGIGYFTHGEHLVNVATWFLSPLLLLYTATMVARLTWPRAAGLVGVVVSAALAEVVDGYYATMMCHCVTFWSGFLLAGMDGRSRQFGSLGAAAVLAVAMIRQPEFRYGVVALVLLCGSGFIRSAGRLPAAFTGIAYEWFLMHGLCVSLTCRYVHSLAAEIPLAALMSLLAAVGLQRTTRLVFGDPTDPDRLARRTADKPKTKAQGQDVVSPSILTGSPIRKTPPTPSADRVLVESR
jgi:hypothetical protein